MSNRTKVMLLRNCRVSLHACAWVQYVGQTYDMAVKHGQMQTDTNKHTSDYTAT